ncbi:MAG TPA: hypothetical protein VGA73_05690 [Candidatus Binatia bacterium]
MKPDRSKIEATLGQLMKAASQVAFEQSEDTLEAYALTSLVLVQMIRRRFAPGPAAEASEADRSYLN